VTSSVYDIKLKSLRFRMYMTMDMPINNVKNIICKVRNYKTFSRAETVRLCKIDRFKRRLNVDK